MTVKTVHVRAQRLYTHPLRRGETFMARVQLRGELAAGENFFQATREPQAVAESLVAAEILAMDKRLKERRQAASLVRPPPSRAVGARPDPVGMRRDSPGDGVDPVPDRVNQ